MREGFFLSLVIHLGKSGRELGREVNEGNGEKELIVSIHVVVRKLK